MRSRLALFLVSDKLQFVETVRDEYRWVARQTEVCRTFRRSFLKSIEDWRTQINALDTELLHLLNKRARLALKVGESKTASGLSLCDHAREREVIERMCQANEGPLDDRAIVELFRAVIHESRRIQTRALDQSLEEQGAHKPSLVRGHVRIAFQGAPGAFKIG